MIVCDISSQLAIEKWNEDSDFEKWQWNMNVVLRRNRVHHMAFETYKLSDDISTFEKEEIEE